MSEATTTLTTLPPEPASLNPESSFSKRMSEGTATAVGTTTTGTTTTGTTTLPPSNTATTTKPPKIAKKYVNAPTTLPPATQQQKIDAKELVQEIFDRVDKKAATEAAKLGEELTPKQKKRLEVLAEMEELDPKYKGLADKARTWVKEAPVAEAAFVKENPNATEEQISEHLAELEQKAGVEWDDDDYSEARISLLAKPTALKLKKAEEELAEIKAGQRAKNVEPIAAAVGTEAVDKAIKTIGGEFLETYGADKRFDEAKWKTLMEEDPVTAEIVGDAIVRTRNFAQDAAACFNGAHTTVAQERQNQVFQFATGLEKEIMSQPPENRMDEQERPFMPFMDYAKLPKAERQKYWTLTADVVADVAAVRIANQAKSDVDSALKKVEKTAAKRFGATKTVTQAQTQPPVTAPPKRPDSVSSKANSAPANVQPAAAVSGGFANRFKNGTV